MDGNRRFAKREHISRKRGHELGYKKLEEVLEWCLELGVKVVTVYAFSIENFRRDSTEVDDLLQLAADRFDQICKEGYATLITGTRSHV
jgi:ditrans,polycis-polyprenyl diphosphate synthase